MISHSAKTQKPKSKMTKDNSTFIMKTSIIISYLSGVCVCVCGTTLTRSPIDMKIILVLINIISKQRKF